MQQRTSTVSHWDAFWEKASLEFNNKIVEEIVARGGIAGKRIIEIGAGSGTTSLKLACGGGAVTCLDYSDSALRLIRKNADTVQARVACVKADGFSLPLKSESYDLCFHQGLIEHFKDPLPMIQEQYRILKKGGLLLVDVPQTYNIYTCKKALLIALNKWFAGWETQFTYAGLKKMVESAGFTAVHGFGRYHTRNLDRIQRKFFKREIIPLPLRNLYYRIVCRLEDSVVGRNTAFAVGIVARK